MADPNIKAVLDEYAVTQVLHNAQAAVGTLANNGSTYLFPCNYSYTANASFSGGTVQMVPPNKVKLVNFNMHYSLYLTVSLDLSDIIPDINIPPFPPFFPGLTYNWPTISLPVSYSSTAQVSTDCTLSTYLAGPDWHVDLAVQTVTQFTIGAAAPIILALIGAAVGPAVAVIPFIGWFITTAVLGITATIGIAGVANLLHVIFTPLVTGTSFTVYQAPQHYPVLPAAGPNDPTVYVNLDSVIASVVNSGEPELEVDVEISP
jgi:hypothetical protein